MIRRIGLFISLMLLCGSFVQAQDTTKDVLVETGRMQTARACHSASVLPNGFVLVAGGIDSREQTLNSAELYNPATGTFIYTVDMIEGRSCAQIITLPDGQVLILGGWGARSPIASIERYDSLTDSFHSAGQMTVPRSGFTATLLNDGHILIVGGSNRRETHASAELYDPATGTTTPTGSLPLPRTAHTATLLSDGRVLITGGSAAELANSSVYDTAELYDPHTGEFTVTASMSTPRYKHAARLLTDGKVLVIGGSDNRDWRGRYNSSEVFDPKTGQFSAAASMSAERFKFDQATTLLTDGTLLVAGGSQLVERYLPVSATFEAVNGQMDADRFYQTATLLPQGAVLITGGYDYDIHATDLAWLYTPSAVK